MTLTMIAHNARRHYAMAGGVPVWNPSLAKFFILRMVDCKGFGTLPFFFEPTADDAKRIARAQGRSGKHKSKQGLARNPAILSAPSSLVSAATRWQW